MSPEQKADKKTSAENFAAMVKIFAQSVSEIFKDPEFKQKAKEVRQQLAIPQKFFGAIAYLPGCGGAALSVDRLVMLLCNTESMDEVIAFTVDTA